ncbi:Endoplasmic reticulum metallopeptidase 1 [Balamuthia mandrillaris]
MRKRRIAESPSSPSSASGDLEGDHDAQHQRQLPPRGAVTLAQTLRLYLALLLLFLALCAFVHREYSLLPAPAPADVPLSQFSEARAYVYLEELIQRIGFRFPGSKNNDVYTARFLLDKILQIEQDYCQTHEDRCKSFEGRRDEAKLMGRVLSIDVQKGSGSFFFLFIHSYFTNHYSEVTNIVVRVPSLHSKNKESLLVNAHFDSGLGGRGASDDGVAVANCLEMIRNLLWEPPLDYDVIFLLNGAEESLLQGSHAFVSQHPWADSVGAVINLEAAGAGGSSTLFQVGSKELARAYALSAKYPHGSVLAQEIFSSGIIPSDTDFRIFRDFGNKPGLDTAFYKNGYVYHTSLDNLDMLTPGSMQHMGDNTLGMIRYLTSEELSDGCLKRPTFSSPDVFFEIFGFLIMYPANFAIVLNLGLSLLAIVYVYFSSTILPTYLNSSSDFARRHFPTASLLSQFSFTARLSLTWLAAVLTPLPIALFMLFVHPLSWFSTPWLSAALYGPPALLGMIATLHFWILRDSAKKNNLTILQRNNSAALNRLIRHSILLFYVVICSALTLAGIQSAFFWMVLLLFQLIGCVVVDLLYDYLICALRDKAPTVTIETVGTERKKRVEKEQKRTTTRNVIYGFVAVLFPTISSIYCAFIVLTMFIPLMGRTGAAVPADLVIGGLIGFLTALISFPLLLFFLQAGNPKPVLKLFLLVCLATILFALFTSPYSDTTPKRLIIQHTYRPPPFTLTKSSSSFGAFVKEERQRDSSTVYEDDLLQFEGTTPKNVVGKSVLLVGGVDSLSVKSLVSKLDPTKKLELKEELKRVSAFDSHHDYSREDTELDFVSIYPFSSFISAVSIPVPLPSPHLFVVQDREDTDGHLHDISVDFNSPQTLRRALDRKMYIRRERKPVPERKHPWLELLEDVYRPETNERTLELRFHYEGYEICSLWIDDSENQTLVSWSLGPELPPAPLGHYFVRHVGGHNITQWDLSLTFKGPQQVVLEIGGVHLVPTEQGLMYLMHFPSWALPATYVWYSEVSSWIIP